VNNGAPSLVGQACVSMRSQNSVSGVNGVLKNYADEQAILT